MLTDANGNQIPPDDLPEIPPSKPRVGRPRKNSGDALEAAARVRKMIQMKLAGLSYDEIARQIGYGRAEAAHRAVKRYIHKLPSLEAHELRKIENERLDTLQTMLWQRLGSSDTPGLWFAALDRILRVSEARRRLNGLDLTPLVLQQAGYGEPASANPTEDPGAIAWRERFQSLPVAARQEIYDAVFRVVGPPSDDRPL
jgi:hypothetical protein